jgi:hypothetical protein
MELSRRRFMQFLSAAPVVLAFDPHRTIFDLGRNKIWTPPPVEIIPAQLGEWTNLGGLMDRSIAMVLAQYGEQMEQTQIYGDHIQTVLFTPDRKSSLQV